MCYCPTPTLHLNLALTGDGAFLLSLKKTHSVWFISILNYGDTENVLINHLLLVIPMSYPCHYTDLCPHKPQNMPTHTHTHSHTLTYTHTLKHSHTLPTHTHTHTHTHNTHTTTHTHIYIYKHTLTHTHLHTHTHTHTHINLQTHTHTHTHKHVHKHTLNSSGVILVFGVQLFAHWGVKLKSCLSCWTNSRWSLCPAELRDVTISQTHTH